MITPSVTVRRLLGSVITVITPFIIMMTAIRLLITPIFPQIEYRMPYFPDDPYGFTQEERLHWSQFAINYLVNDASISYLGDLTFDDGQPLYNERELGHMVDVKNLVQAAIKVWLIGLFLVLVFGIWAKFSGWISDFRAALSRGGWATIGLIAVILVAVAISFTALFTTFHRIFFQGDSWIFLFSDTLIRLFPLPFWRDAFIWVGVLSLLGGALVGWLARPHRTLQDEEPLSRVDS